MNDNYSLRSPYSLNAKKVKIRLIEKDLRIGDLVDMLDIGQPTVSKYINGMGRNPKIQQAIADALGLPLEEILYKPSSIAAHEETT